MQGAFVRAALRAEFEDGNSLRFMVLTHPIAATTIMPPCLMAGCC